MERYEDKDKENEKNTSAIAYDDILIMHHKNFVILACDDSNWILDSSASCPIIPRHDFFILLMTLA